MYQQAGSELHAMFHPLWLYPPDYVNSHDGELDAERSRSVAGAPPVEISVGRINALLAFDRRAGLARIKAPTLIIASDNDFITPAYHAEALGRAIPGARLAILRGGGHSISKTRTEEFNRLVLEFLEG
jgi:aminoacrylate hydrolase